MLVGVAVGFELARDAASPDRPSTKEDAEMELRFLGHAAFALSDGGTTVLIDPFLTGNPKAAASAPTSSTPTRSCSRTATPTTSATRSRSRSAPARPVVAIVELASEIARARASRRARPEPRRHRRRSTGARCKLVPGLAHVDDAEAARVNTPAGLLIEFGGKTIYHLGDTGLFSRPRSCVGARPRDRRRARADRRPLHDGPLRRGRRGAADRRHDRSSRSTTTRSRRSRPTRRRSRPTSRRGRRSRSSCSRRARR